MIFKEIILSHIKATDISLKFKTLEYKKARLFYSCSINVFLVRNEPAFWGFTDRLATSRHSNDLVDG